MKRTTLSPTVRAGLQHSSPLLTELSVFFVFLFLTAVMTWPWVLNLRDAASDSGDPYFASWVLWWDYHQTFHQPLRLFQGNIFFPYHYTLAFSEHHYGIAIFLFPLFALGLAPLTIHGIATLLSFAFCGYGAFRLGRTLTGSTAIAWIIGIVYAFIPYRFGQLPHLVYLSSGWIPMVLEALVLFARTSSRRRAVWLGVTFFLNALSSIHWFVLTLIPLGLSAVVLLTRNHGWRNIAFWRRGVLAFGIACLALLPFLIPYVQVARLYGFVRSPDDAFFYSAKLRDWLVGEFRNKIWHGLNTTIRAPERSLFPGFIPPLLAMGAIFLVGPGTHDSKNIRTPAWSKRRILILLDFIIFISLILMITISGYGFFKLRIFGTYLLKIYSITPVVWAFGLALLTRLTIAYPKAFVYERRSSMRASLQDDRRSDAFWIGIIWTVTGFCGSLGMNFIFHRALFEYVPLFRSIRVPARWAMICYLGLALLAGLGTKQLAAHIARHWSRVRPNLVYVVIALALLMEQRSAPLNLIHGEVDPDPLTIRLKQTQMAGGLAELPYGETTAKGYLYTLRAADHGQPLITAVSGFTPPIQTQIQFLSESHPIPEKFIDLLESIPCSYLVIHNQILATEERPTLEALLRRNTSSGRLRYINSYGEADLYAISKIEPNAHTEAALPAYLTASEEASESEPSSNESAKPPSPIDDPQFFTRVQYRELLGRDPDRGGMDFWLEQFHRCGTSPLCLRQTQINVSTAFFSSDEFQQTAFFIYSFYTKVLGRPPEYAEFVAARSTINGGGKVDGGKEILLTELMKKKDFVKLYPSNLSDGEFLDRLLGTLKNSGFDLRAERETLSRELNGSTGRAKVIRGLLDASPWTAEEYIKASIRLAYFVYLERDPDPAGYAFWVSKVDSDKDNGTRTLTQAFISSDEYRSRFKKR